MLDVFKVNQTSFKLYAVPLKFDFGTSWLYNIPYYFNVANPKLTPTYYCIYWWQHDATLTNFTDAKDWFIK